MNSLKERWIGFRWRMKHSLDKNAIAGWLSVPWPGMSDWLRLNWLPILLIAAVFIVELSLALGYGVARPQFIYWWLVVPGDYLLTVDLICLIGIVVSFLLRNVRWYVRVLVVMPFILLVFISLLWAFILMGLFTHPEHVSSVTFQGHVYHLSFEDDISGEYYTTFFLYECDSAGWWCHDVDTIPMSYADRQSVVLAADDAKNTLYIIQTDSDLEGTRIIKQYVGARGEITAQPTPTAP
jgi:hypothetical protein